jgi:gas vesicle protein
MKFIKGMLIGGIVTAGVAMVYAETMGQNKKKMMKKGKQFVKRMGII